MPIDRIDDLLDGDDSEGAETENLLPDDGPLEPGHPAPENVFFVLLGVVLALAVVGRLVMIYG